MVHTYTQPGVYLASVTARNNLNEITANAIRFTVQDLVGDIIISIPNIITVNQTVIISTSVTSGTDLTVEVLVNDSTLFNTSSYVADSPLDLPFVFSHIGELQLLLRVANLISFHNVSATALVVKEIHVVVIEIQQQPVVGEDVILIAKVNEYLWKNRAYIYKWTLFHNQTVTTGSPVLLYSCGKAGLHRVSLSVSNLASETSSEHFFNVSKLGSGPRLSHLPNVAAGKPVIFTFKNVSPDMGDVVMHFGEGNMTNISASSSNSFTINHTYAVAGIYNIDAFFSKQIFLLSSTIVIQDLIQNLCLMGPTNLSIATSPLQPTMAKWKARLGSGSNYIFLWLYSDGTMNHTLVGPNQLIMAINSTGLISIEVVAQNEVSCARASMTTVAQYPIMSTTITVARVALNKVSNIVLNVKPKQDYIIAIDYGDGTNDLFEPHYLDSRTGCLETSLRCLNFAFYHKYAAVGQYHLSATASNNVSTVVSTAIAVVEEPITGLNLILNSPRVIKFKDYINATASVQTGTEVTFQWIISVPHSNPFIFTQECNLVSMINYQAQAGGNYYVKVIISSPLYSSPFSRLLPGVVKVRTPIVGLQALFPFNTNSAKLLLQPDGSYATQILGFSVHTFSEEVKFSFDFGDGSPLLIVSGMQSSFDGTFASGRHKFTKEGVFYITVSAFNEFYNATNELGAYYVQLVPEGLLLTMNSSVIHKNEVILFSAILRKGTDVTYSWNMGDQTSYVDEAVYIFTNKTIYATFSDIVFTAITAEDDPLQFAWHFGDKPPVKTTSRTITTRYSTPGRYNVVVNASNQISSFTSNIYPIELQQVVEPNRLRMNNQDLTSVQIVGSVVYNNYTVNVEILPTPPVSLISGGTQLFMTYNHESIISLNGSESYDPDYPGTADLRFSWACETVSGLNVPCFKPDSPDPLNTTSSMIDVSVSALKTDIDQFVFKLTVNNKKRYSSEAQQFITIKKKDNLRLVKIYCIECLNNSINWNNAFSVKAVCEECSETLNLSYSWKLYLVNSTETDPLDVPFCKLVIDNLQSSLYGPVMTVAPSAEVTSSSQTLISTAMNGTSTQRAQSTTSHINKGSVDAWIDSVVQNNSDKVVSTATTSTPSDIAINASTINATNGTIRATTSQTPFPFPVPEEQVFNGRPRARLPRNAMSANASESLQISAMPITSPIINGIENNGSQLHLSETSVTENGANVSNSTKVNNSSRVFGEGSSIATENSTDYSEYDTHYNTVEGTSGSGGRPGFQGGGFSGSNTDTGADTHPSGGSSFGSEKGDGDDVLPDIQPPPASRPSPMIEWTKVAINDRKFETYTTTGIKSQTLTFQPFSLKSKKIYMIEVTVEDQSQTGKAQLFLFMNEAPRGLSCEVRPSIGSEILTHYSMFCTSGRKDLHYEYSYSVGNSTETILYDGRDHEYYFNLPAGEATDEYKLTINAVITDLLGSKTKPCPVTPIVLPRIKTDEELYNQGLQNLSILMLLGNQKETKNYIQLLTRVLYRLHKEGYSTRDFQKWTRNALIQALCSLTISSQRELMETVSVLHDLVNITDEVTLESALVVTRTVKNMIKLFTESREFRMYEELVKEIVFVVSDVMGLTDNGTGTSKSLLFEGLKATTELLLMYVVINNQSQFYMNTNLMELQTTQNYGFQNTVQSTQSVKFYLPDLLDKQISDERSSCIISHLISFKQNPYLWGMSPLEINGDVADLTLYNCTNRRKIEVKGLKSPILIEFERKDTIQEHFSVYLLLRTQMNVHILPVTPANIQQALQIRVNFNQSNQQVFPVMLLVRFNKEPTPSKYNLKQIHYWDGETIHLFIPASSLLGVGTYYLGLLDANYNRRPKNNYLANNVSYTVNIQWTQCLYWDDNREWKSDGCSPQQKSDSEKINCSCNHMTTFTVLHEELVMKEVQFTDVMIFISVFENYATCITVLFALTLYILLVILCKRMDFSMETKPGLVVLQDNTPTDQYLYEIIVETGFRTRAGTTAKVYIKLHGEDGVSETRELFHPEQQLFERNSRHTFIMSVPENLGSIWKVRLWHNNGGHSPSWYVTSIVVKDLLHDTCWFFPAECWLAVEEGDGKVERELISLTHGLGFKRLLYSKLTDYMEDFHLWGSVYSRPSYSSFTHTQRLSVCLCLLLGYMCLNAILTYLKDEEYTAELGLIDVSTTSLVTGLITTVVVLPIVLLVSLLFRFSKVKSLQEASVEEQYVTARESVEAHRDAHLALDSAFESYLSWQNLQQWAQEVWRKKYERGLLESQTPSIHSERYSKRSNKKDGNCLSEGSSSGFEDCSSQENAKPVPKDSTRSSSELRSDYSSEHSSLFDRPVVNRTRHFLPTWCNYLAWMICLLIALVCILTTSLLGLRFGPTESVLWLHSLFFSLLYCIFIIQPIAIFCTAAVVALKNKNCNDIYNTVNSHSSSEPCKQWNTEAGILSERSRIDINYNPYNSAMDLDRIVAARQRARYLRLARPPTLAQLKEARDRMRKESLIQQTLQEFVLYIVMLILLLLITFGKFSKDEYYLNQAIRAEFTRNQKNSFINIKTVDDWWNWSFGALLHGLYWDTWYNNAAAKSQAGPLHGKCYLIGVPTLRKIQVDTNSICNIPEVLSGFIQHCQSPYTTVIHNPAHSNTTKHVGIEQSSQCGQFNCYRGTGSVINLSRTRHKTSATLLTLKETRWINQNTRAVMVEFTLYNPPTNLFTTVSLLAEFPPLGGVLPSARIESVSIYQKNSVVNYFIMAFEIGIVMVSLFYYVYYVFYFVLAVDIIDHLHSGYFKAFVDMSFISAWMQVKRFLHGLIVFLLLIKSIRLLRVNKSIAPCVTMLRLSYSCLMFPMLCCILVILAYSCLGNLLFLSESYSFSTTVRAVQTVLMCFMGMSEMKTLSTLYKLNQLSIGAYYGTFFIIMTILWAGLFIGIFTSMAEEAKKSSRSKHLNFYLDEFENLMDELLFRLNALSNSLHHSLPAKPHFLGDSPSGLGHGYYYNQRSENHTFHENHLEHKIYKLEEELFQNNLQFYELLLPGREHHSDSDITDFKTLRSKLELETLHQLKLRQEKMYETLEIAQNDNAPKDPPKNVEADLSTALNDFSFPDNVIKIVPCCASNPCETICNSVSESYSTSINKDSAQLEDTLSAEHYNLANLGDTLPHVLCGIKCPEKQAAQTRMLESKVTGQHRCSSASTLGKNRKQLKRSHTTVIQILDNSKELAVETFKISEQASFDPSTQCFGKSMIKSSSRQHPSAKVHQNKVLEEQKGSESKPVNLPEKLGSSILSSQGNGGQNENTDVPDLPGSIKQCW
ncbi:hypothetical protein chiPu_0000959 [Chiloscyllium punctatum]|uniref:Polycystin-1-like protein 1 n=1 Tax=Chiloscyllium punctatum TaxID=137246 RepID=A0A401RWR4_CHIPU|nr:hypothetical protein [Chiloscyllium punctatum]